MRVGLIDGKFRLNPTARELSGSSLDLIVTSTERNIVMVEGVGREVAEDTFCEAVLFAHEEVQPLLATLKQLKEERGKAPRTVNLQTPSPELEEFISSECREGIQSILSDSSHKKLPRDSALRALLSTASEKLSLRRDSDSSLPPSPPNSSLVTSTFWSLCGQQLQSLALNSGIRCDGRGLDGLRPISCEVDLLPTLHGSALFKRGETQVFCTVTFDSPESASQADLISMILGAQKYKRFMIHYEFPPFSTNEVGRFLQTGRREIGHGTLAEKAFLPVLPPQFPFTIRVTSQVLDSNGSSSMATVCGASLALYDAGVPLSRPVAGVACGLVTRQDPTSGELQDYRILTDISGIEDAQGNMDFKVAGTSEGITSLQLDTKNIPGIPFHVFRDAVMKSRDARLRVLATMDQCQASPRPELKDNGPAYATIEVPPDKRRKLVGSGGHRIRALVSETGAEVRTVSEDQMSVFAPTREVLEDLLGRVESILQEEEENEVRDTHQQHSYCTVCVCEFSTLYWMI
jgi:polyribonucleotide nucleotidyltransferase